MHTSLLTPYFSWRVSHHRHHSNHASMERDETYVPKTRSDLGISADATPNEIEHLLEDTPLYTLFMLIKQQIFAFDAYLREWYATRSFRVNLTHQEVYNVSGQVTYPKWTNHFNRKFIPRSFSNAMETLTSPQQTQSYSTRVISGKLSCPTSVSCSLPDSSYTPCGSTASSMSSCSTASPGSSSITGL